MTDLIESEMKEVLRNYGLELKSFKKIDGGIINDTYLVITQDDEKFIVQKVVLCDSGESIDAEARFINFLKENGFPVAPILVTDKNKNYCQIDKKFWRVFRHIEHDEIAGKTVERIYETGKLLGRFHRFFKDCPEKERLVDSHPILWSEDLLKKLKRLLEIHKADEEVVELANKLGEITYQYKLDKDVGINIIHGDPKFNNFLFKGNEIVGVLDLDGVNIGSELFDLGDALRSWCKEGDFKFKKDSFKAALEGYLSENDQEYISKNAREAMIAITNRLCLRFLIDAFEQKHFHWDKEKYFSGYEAHLASCKKYLGYCESIINSK